MSTKFHAHPIHYNLFFFRLFLKAIAFVIRSISFFISFNSLADVAFNTSKGMNGIFDLMNCMVFCILCIFIGYRDLKFQHRPGFPFHKSQKISFGKYNYLFDNTDFHFLPCTKKYFLLCLNHHKLLHCSPFF